MRSRCAGLYSFIAARRESPTPLAKRQVSLGQRTNADGAEKSAFVSHPVEPAVELLEEAHRREPAVDFVALALVLGLVVLAAVRVRAIMGGWNFYPNMAGTSDIIALVPAALLYILPFAVLAVERIRWELLP